jgi:type I restriction enzyme S subunit
VLKVERAVVDPNFLALVLNSPRCYEQSQLYTKGATNQILRVRHEYWLMAYLL